MKGLMMDYQLTLPTILRRAEALFGKKEIAAANRIKLSTVILILTWPCAQKN